MLNMTLCNHIQSVDERVRHQMEMVGEAEKRLTQLQTERENLEGRLQRTPKTGGRVTRDAKQTQVNSKHNNNIVHVYIFVVPVKIMLTHTTTICAYLHNVM